MEQSNGLADDPAPDDLTPDDLTPDDLTPDDLTPDWASLPPPQVFGAVILVLRAGLPPPVVDMPGEWRARDQVAMAAVGSLAPASAAEGRLAAQFVAADAYAMECLRLAQLFRLEPDVARQCAAQAMAMAMMRESKSAMRVLLRVQAVRRAVSENPVAVRQADWVEHAAVNLMAEALAAAPAAVPALAGVCDRGEATARDLWELRQMSDAEIAAALTRAETMVGFQRPAEPAVVCGVGAAPLLPVSSHQGRR